MKKLKVMLLVILAVALLAPVGAWASTKTATMPVSLTAQTVTSVSAGNLSFGNVPVGMGGEASSTITVKATSGLPYTIGLDAGQHWDFNFGASGIRQLAKGTTIGWRYLLYQSNIYGIEWGDDGATVNALSQSAIGTGFDQSITVYGSLIAPVNGVPEGSYTDSVLVTVTY